MKKGHRYPAVRARWLINLPHYTNVLQPVWGRLRDLILVYIGTVLGVPFPFTVTEDDVTDSVWSYWPEFSAVVYHGTWDNGDKSGTWEWIVGWEDTTNLFRDVFNIRFTDEVGVHKLTLTATPTEIPGFYQEGHNWRKVNTEYAFDLPWVPAGLATIEAEDYATIRARGRDSDNTGPLDWDYPGPP